jgi:hypothetical protein
MNGVSVVDEQRDSPSSESPHPSPAEALAARADDGERDRELHPTVFLSAQGMEQNVRGAAREPELRHRHAGAGTLIRIERVEMPREAAETPPDPPASREPPHEQREERERAHHSRNDQHWVDSH